MSRGGAGSKDWPFAATALHSHFGPFERHFTTGPGEASLVAQSEAESGRRLLLTFGGDGTISETAHRFKNKLRAWRFATRHWG